IRIEIVLAVLTILNTTLSFKTFDYDGYRIPILYPDLFDNIAIQTMTLMRQSLLPDNVTLIQTSPGQAFFAQIYVASLLALILTIPIIIIETISFVGPGLYRHESTFVKKITVVAIGLFGVGCTFSYLVVIPIVLEFLYKYGAFIGITTFLDISQFVPFVLQFLLAFGVSFQLPLLMWGLTISGFIPPKIWRNNLRYVIIVLAIFGALVTPDGSGITMWLVAGPMLSLYLCGMLVVERAGRNIS
ncbi:MAG: twin-arginine translocase subunit TatC, partial [Nitrososphaeraceae archaeon]